jgi:hypothetical protein
VSPDRSAIRTRNRRNAARFASIIQMAIETAATSGSARKIEYALKKSSFKESSFKDCDRP